MEGIPIPVNILLRNRQRALAVARRLVLFLKRPGGQRQFSAELLARVPEAARRKACICATCAAQGEG